MLSGWSTVARARRGERSLLGYGEIALVLGCPPDAPAFDWLPSVWRVRGLTTGKHDYRESADLRPECRVGGRRLDRAAI
jgi:hypothetical protein